MRSILATHHNSGHPPRPGSASAWLGVVFHQDGSEDFLFSSCFHCKKSDVITCISKNLVYNPNHRLFDFKRSVKRIDSIEFVYKTVYHEIL